ncbi:MAG TPA: hypothetical protein VK348_07015 [Planctomycetota bacterium]|nr:hypothetical protein [Planctomycetota bacterium]
MAIAFAGSLAVAYAGAHGSAERLRPGVVAWQQDLDQLLASKLRRPLPWRDDLVAERFDLGPAGWMALRLFAFHAERTDLELPDTVPPLLELDPEWRKAADAGFGTSRYGQLLPCRLWLPAEFPFTLKAPLPDGELAEIGSLPLLRDQLRWLNGRSFQADEREQAGWLQLPAPAGGELLAAARRGFAGLGAAVAVAVSRSAPLIVQDLQG